MATRRVSNNKPANENPEDLMEFEQFVSHQPKAKSSRGWLISTIIIIIIILVGAIYFLNQGKLGKDHKLQAIFLDNNQVYFAKVIKQDSFSLYLDDVYYIETQQQVVPATEEGGEDQVINVPSIVKRGSELHKPQGYLKINRSKVISIEEIGQDSEVMKEIERINSTPTPAPAQ